MNIVNEKYIKELTVEELRIERIRYNLLVYHDINSMRFNDDINKRINNYIYNTVILGGIIFWLGLSDDSNIYKILLNKFSLENIKLFINMIVLFLLIVPNFGNIISLKRKVKKFYAQALLLKAEQNKIFYKFIMKEIEKKENMHIEDLQQLAKIILREGVYDIEFSESDFEKFITEYLQKYKYKFPLSFYKNYTNLILLNQCIDDILIQKKSDTFNSYILIIDKNYSLLLYNS